MELTKKSLAKRIDHSFVEQDATEEIVRIACAEAKKYQFASVYVNPCYLPLVKELLQGSGIPVGTPIGFPFGATTTEVKIYETEQVLRRGADIIDVVMNVGMFKSGKTRYVKDELEQIVATVRRNKPDVVIKVIIETCNLSRDEIVEASKIVEESGADYVKTSSGSQGRGATIDEIKIIRDSVGGNMKIKAAAGIKTTEKALAVIEAGADCIGENAGVSIVEGLDVVLSLRARGDID